MTNVYILSLSYTNSTPHLTRSPIWRNISNTLNDFKGSARLEVRTGYFGMCVRQRGVLWLCSTNANGLAEQVGAEHDPLNLIGMASKFKDDVLFSGLLFMAIVLALICILLLATFPTWQEERDRETGSEIQVKPFPSRPITQLAISCSFVAAMLCLVSALWQHIGSVGAAAMAETANYGNVKSEIGAGAMALGWFGFVILIIVAIALFVMILSIVVLDRLTDD
jgi:hypothetical protein